jgi:3'-5' exoribonuclease
MSPATKAESRPFRRKPPGWSRLRGRHRIHDAGVQRVSTGPLPQRRSLADVRPGERIDDEIFRIVQKELRTSGNGSLYIHAVLADASSQMVARMWNATREMFESIGENGLMHVRGRVESYRGRPQLIIDGLRQIEPGSVDPSDFLPRTQDDVPAMWERVKQILRTIRDPDLLALIGKFVNEESFAERFRKAPAARSLHHAFIGGLLEHTRNVLELATVVLERYPRVNRDLVLAGMFLHDAGKVAELSYESSFEYTVEGQLVGHIVQASVWVQEAARALEAETGRAFPRLLLAALLHIIVSHHGRYEFGSPKLPATAEAFVVHHLDNLDAKLNMVFAAIDADADDSNAWTSWIPALETKIFKPQVDRPPGS